MVCIPCVGVNCDARKEKVSFLECSVCDKCNKFPTILKKRFTFPTIRAAKPRPSVTHIIGCLRQSYLKMTKPFYMDRSGLISINIGTAIHEYILPMSDISEKFLLWTTPNGKECIGYLDAVSISKRILYDIKTIPHGWYQRDAGPKERDKLQVQIYATILKHVYGVDLHGLRLVYIGLGDKECMEMEVPYDDKTEFINSRTDELQGYLDRNETPRGKPAWPEWECKYCPFSEDCPEKVELERTAGKPKAEKQETPGN